METSKLNALYETSQRTFDQLCLYLTSLLAAAFPEVRRNAKRRVRAVEKQRGEIQETMKLTRREQHEFEEIMIRITWEPVASVCIGAALQVLCQTARQRKSGRVRPHEFDVVFKRIDIRRVATDAGLAVDQAKRALDVSRRVWLSKDFFKIPVIMVRNGKSFRFMRRGRGLGVMLVE